MASTNIFISHWILWIFFTSSSLGRKNISTKSEMFDLKLIHRHNTSCCCFFDTFPAFTHHQKDSGVSEQYFALISMQFETFRIETITIHFGSLCFIEKKNLLLDFQIDFLHWKCSNIAFWSSYDSIIVFFCSNIFNWLNDLCFRLFKLLLVYYKFDPSYLCCKNENRIPWWNLAIVAKNVKLLNCFTRSCIH